MVAKKKAVKAKFKVGDEVFYIYPTGKNRYWIVRLGYFSERLCWPVGDSVDYLIICATPGSGPAMVQVDESCVFDDFASAEKEASSRQRQDDIRIESEHLRELSLRDAKLEMVLPAVAGALVGASIMLWCLGLFGVI